jgi:hypothetical protein
LPKYISDRVYRVYKTNFKPSIGLTTSYSPQILQIRNYKDEYDKFINKPVRCKRPVAEAEERGGHRAPLGPSFAHLPPLLNHLPPPFNHLPSRGSRVRVGSWQGGAARGKG